MSAPQNRWQAISQARDYAGFDDGPSFPEALQRLETIFTLLEPWARQTVGDLVEETRAAIGKGEPLPHWSPEQWITAINVQLGFAAMNLHADVGAEDRETGILNLRAVAAVAMDAIEALENR